MNRTNRTSRICQIRRRSSGFTLLELILAMLIAAMLSLSLYGAMSTAFKARKTARAVVQTMRSGTVATELIRADLESVPPPGENLAGPFIGTHNQGARGDSDYLQFSTIASGTVGNDDPMNEGIREVELYLDATANPPMLMRRTIRNLLPVLDTKYETEILARDVRAFSLRYFNGTGWQENWDSTQVENALPLAVGLTISVNDPRSIWLVNGQPVREITRVIPLANGKAVDPADATATGTTVQ